MKGLLLMFIVFFCFCPKAQDFEQLYGKLSEYYQNKQYEEGIKLKDDFILSAEKQYGKNDTTYATALNFMGFFFQLTYRYQEAHDLYQEAHKIFKTYSKPLYCANTAINLADVKIGLKQYGDAEDLYKEALEIYKGNPGTINNYITFLPSLAKVYELMQKYNDAQKTYEQIANFYKTTYGQQSEYYAYGLFLLAQFQEKKANYPDAKKYYQDALRIYKQILGENHSSVASTINYLAHVLDLMGEYGEAEMLYKKSLGLYKTLYGENSEYYASILNNLANLCKNTSRRAEAYNYYVSVADIYEKTLGVDHEYYATVLNNIAIIYAEERLYKEAEQMYMKVYKTYSKIYGELHPFTCVCLINIGEMFFVQKDYASARTIYEKVMDYHEKAGRNKDPDYAVSLDKYTLVLIHQKEYKNALSFSKKALSIQLEKVSEHHLNVLYNQAHLANLYQKNKMDDKAWETYLVAYENFVYLIDNYFPYLSENEKESFYRSTFDEIIAPLYRFALNNSDNNPERIGQVYDVQMKTKALLLNSSNSIRNSIYASNDQKLISLYEIWNAQKELLGKSFAMTDEELEQKHINVDSLSMAINDLEKQISLKSNDFAKLYSTTPSWKALQSKLAKNEAAIEIIKYYEEGDSIETYAALILRYDRSPKLVKFKNGDYMDTKYYAYYMNSIKKKQEDALSYKQFWQSIDAELVNIQKIYLSPDGVYNKLSIKSIYNTSIKKYLSEVYEFRMVSNTREVLDQKAEIKMSDLTKNTAYFMGYPDYKASMDSLSRNPTQDLISMSNVRGGVDSSISRFFDGSEIPELEGTQKEINEIVPLVNASQMKTIAYSRHHASEENIKNAKNVGVLHIATHGFFISENNTNSKINTNKMEGNPLFSSGLLLAGAQNSISGKAYNKSEDGILRAYEAMNLNLNNTTLVVLSACETGLGEIQNGEGVYGLQRAFSVAGARYVIMSLWKVDDTATKDLMVSFYKNWFASGNIHQAFDKAQKEIKEKYKAPHYWAAFVLSGL